MIFSKFVLATEHVGLNIILVPSIFFRVHISPLLKKDAYRSR